MKTLLFALVFLAAPLMAEDDMPLKPVNVPNMDNSYFNLRPIPLAEAGAHNAELSNVEQDQISHVGRRPTEEPGIGHGVVHVRDMHPTARRYFTNN